MVGLDVSLTPSRESGSLLEGRPSVHPLARILAHPASVLPDQ